MPVYDQCNLRESSGATRSTWILDDLGNRLFMAATNKHSSAFSDEVPALIEGISYHWRHEAHQILRRGIFTVQPIQATSYTATRLCAKSLRFAAPPPPNHLKTLIVPAVKAPAIELGKMRIVGLHSELNGAWHLLELLAARAHSIESAAALLKRATSNLTGNAPRSKLHAKGRVGALVMDASGNVLAISFNLPDLCQIWHAEWLLLQSIFNTKGLVLISTRKPCRMCAALIFASMQKFVIQRVFYLDFDSGPHARSTLLNDGSYDRLRFAPQVKGELESNIALHWPDATRASIP